MKYFGYIWYLKYVLRQLTLILRDKLTINEQNRSTWFIIEYNCLGQNAS
jgi:hypothetical protein